MSKNPEIIKKKSFEVKNLIFYIIPVILLAIFAQLAMKPRESTDPRSKAQAVDSIYIVPATATVGAGTPTVLQVRLNVGTKFADVIGGRIAIDTTKVQVAPAGVVFHTSGLGGNAGHMTAQISPSSAEVINATGNIDFGLIADPLSTDVRPTGDMLLLEIPVISVNTGTQNVETQVTFHPFVTEVFVESSLPNEPTLITLAKNNAVLTVSPVSEAEITPSITPGITITVTPSPTGEVTITPSNTPSSTPTRTPTPTQDPGVTPSVTPTPVIVNDTDISFDLRLRLNGVDGANAQGSLATVRFVKNQLDLVTTPLPLVYIGNGVYALQFSTSSIVLTPGSGYSMIIKAEKHLSRRYCKQTGQTTVCQSFESMSIDVQMPGSAPQLYDFTGLSLAPGDLMVQDGRADLADFEKIKSRMAISCDQLTDEDKKTADVDYNGCVNILDAFWMRNTLETRYDEN